MLFNGPGKGLARIFLANFTVSYPAMQVLRHTSPIGHPPQILKGLSAGAVTLEKSGMANVEAPTPPADQGFHTGDLIRGHNGAPARAFRKIYAMLEEVIVVQPVIAELHFSAPFRPC